MFATFDESIPPYVHVTFNGCIRNTSDFTHFTDKWIELYDRGIEFVYTFDTRKMGLLMNPKWCFKMASFIKRLKQRRYHYLKYSVILVRDKHIQFLLKLIFKTQKPVAPVYLTFSPEDVSLIHQCIEYGVTVPPDVDIIYP